MLTVARRLRVPIVWVRIPAVRHKTMYKVEYRKTKGKGRGVFALKSFEKGEVIEECPVIPLTTKESLICDQTVLEYYLYPWRGKKDGAVVLGYGFLYNHSFNPNTRYYLRFPQKKIIYKAIHPIKKGEEILVNYNGDPKNKGALELLVHHGNSAQNKHEIDKFEARE